MNTCFLHRLVAGLWLDEVQKWPSMTQRHVKHCTACREALESERQLHRRLRRTADRHAAPAPARLSIDVLRRVGDSNRSPHAAQGWSGTALALRLALGGVAVASLVFAWVNLSGLSPRPEGTVLLTGPAVMTELRTRANLDRWGTVAETVLQEQATFALQAGQTTLSSWARSVLTDRAAEAFMQEMTNLLFASTDSGGEAR